VKVVCPNGHKFPVNLEKNTNRDYVFCPKCRAKVIVRKKHIFSPSPTWDREKEEREYTRKEIRQERRPAPVAPQAELYHRGYMNRVLGALAFSKLIMKREEEKKREQERGRA